MKLTKRKGFNFFRSYYDVFNELENDKDKIAFIEALLDRQFLGTKPEGLKGMAKFAYISQTNSIDSQVKGYEDKTGIKLTPTDGGATTPIRQLQVEEKEEVQVEGKVQDVFNFKNSLINYGFDSDLIDDWLAVRKLKKSKNTKTAYQGFIREIEKSDLDKNEILRMCAENSWAGFKNEWIKNDNNGKSNTKSRGISDESLEKWISK